MTERLRAPSRVPLRDLLFDSSPYDGFDAAPFADDIAGERPVHPALAGIVARARPRRIVDVGSWNGAAAIAMAQQVRAMNLNCEIACVDTWLGAPEHWLGGPARNRAVLSPRHGYPRVYFTFLANILRRGLQDIVTPMPMATEDAAQVLRTCGLLCDIVHIGGQRPYQPTRRALSEFWGILTDNGVMIGSDYGIAPGITQAVDAFARDTGCAMQGTHGVCIIFKPEADSALRLVA